MVSELRLKTAKANKQCTLDDAALKPEIADEIEPLAITGDIELNRHVA